MRSLAAVLMLRWCFREASGVEEVKRFKVHRGTIKNSSPAVTAAAKRGGASFPCCRRRWWSWGVVQSRYCCIPHHINEYYMCKRPQFYTVCTTSALLASCKLNKVDATSSGRPRPLVSSRSAVGMSVLPGNDGKHVQRHPEPEAWSPPS